MDKKELCICIREIIKKDKDTKNLENLTFSILRKKYGRELTEEEIDYIKKSINREILTKNIEENLSNEKIKSNKSTEIKINQETGENVSVDELVKTLATGLKAGANNHITNTFAKYSESYKKTGKLYPEEQAIVDSMNNIVDTLFKGFGF